MATVDPLFHHDLQSRTAESNGPVHWVTTSYGSLPLIARGVQTPKAASVSLGGLRATRARMVRPLCIRLQIPRRADDEMTEARLATRRERTRPRRRDGPREPGEVSNSSQHDGGTLTARFDSVQPTTQ